MKRRLLLALAAAVLAMPAPAAAIRGWTVGANSPQWSNNGMGLLFRGWSCANPYCGGPAAWGDVTTFAQAYYNESWQTLAYACDPNDCGTLFVDYFQADVYVQACVHGTSYRTQTNTSALLTGGWQYTTVYSSSRVLC